MQPAGCTRGANSLTCMRRGRRRGRRLRHCAASSSYICLRRIFTENEYSHQAGHGFVQFAGIFLEKFLMQRPTLTWDERLYYRDKLRAARYSALADSEGFGEICFAIEALGLRLNGKEAALGPYVDVIKELASDSIVLVSMAKNFPMFFSTFSALYETLRKARNDVMHSGVYARHATIAAIELCIGLEEALMKEQQINRRAVADYMVKSPVIIQAWQPIAHARQLMLTHSFSYLPVNLDGWKIVSEFSMARFLHGAKNRAQLLATSIEDAVKEGLLLTDAHVVSAGADAAELLRDAVEEAQSLWLVEDGHGGICGVLSPFELM